MDKNGCCMFTEYNLIAPLSIQIMPAHFVHVQGKCKEGGQEHCGMATASLLSGSVRWLTPTTLMWLNTTMMHGAGCRPPPAPWRVRWGNLIRSGIVGISTMRRPGCIGSGAGMITRTGVLHIYDYTISDSFIVYPR